MPRDFSKAYTEAELEEVRNYFREMPTYDAKEESISSRDLGDLYGKMGYDRSPIQLAAYKAYWDAHYNGKILLVEHIKTCTAMHDPVAMVKIRAAAYDSDGNGFISMDEFAEFMKLVKIHIPTLAEINFQEFVQVADTNKDGKVSVDEFAVWIASCLNN